MEEQDCLVPHDQSDILTHDEFEELVQECRKFYAAYSPDDLVEIKAAKERQRAEYVPARPPASTREPKNGYVYLMRSDEGHYKIGRTKNLNQRAKQIGTKMPFGVSIVHSIKSDDYERAELYYHEKYASKRGNGEWFNLSELDISEIKRTSYLNYAGMALSPDEQEELS